MAQLQALLKIVADVVGEGKVQALGRTIGGLGDTANRVSGGLRGMVGAAGGLSGALGALAPVVTGVGLGAMAKGAIDAADDMNDLSQKTGVSVEQLSKFKQAADASGSSIEGVGGAMIKLNKNLATGNDKAANALKDLGISAEDANGNLKSTDQIMLEVADKFAKMPDGAAKSATAMALFGKSGADMIPMLNGGSEAVSKLSATMTTEFAQGADALNDKLVAVQTKLTTLGVNLGTALMPALNIVADGVIALANGFSALPGPLQNLILLGTGLAVAWGPLTGILSGVTFALAAIGPAIPPVIAAFTALLTFIGSTFVPTMLAFFSGPAGWTVLAIAAVVAMVIAFRKPITDFLTWAGTGFMNFAKSVGTWLNPIGIALQNLWNGAIKNASSFFNGLTGLAQRMVAMVRAPFEAMGNAIRSVFNAILQTINRGLNSAINAINFVIRGYNALPSPDLALIPNVAIPQFAQGGVVDRPTLAMVGEGGEREYIIPESKMAAASSRFLAGSRGDAVLGSSQINITTGPVLQQDGQQWVSLADLERAMRQTEASTLARIRTPSARLALGIRR